MLHAEPQAGIVDMRTNADHGGHAAHYVNVTARRAAVNVELIADCKLCPPDEVELVAGSSHNLKEPTAPRLRKTLLAVRYTTSTDSKDPTRMVGT